MIVMIVCSAQEAPKVMNACRGRWAGNIATYRICRALDEPLRAINNMTYSWPLNASSEEPIDYLGHKLEYPRGFLATTAIDTNALDAASLLTALTEQAQFSGR